ncbi:PE-PGRS family protein [Streptomyces sp. NPDC092359]|uniref:PE-PGRS family protein n=1 Tax=Streptomyces sp. NPDC092359 TaxID=3366014 RepID=UPI0038156FD3
MEQIEQDVYEEFGTFVHGWEWLGLNRAVPEDLLIRLLPFNASFLLRADLPSAVVEAAAGHPERRVRDALSDARHALTPAQWDRHLRAEPSAAVRSYFVEDAVRSRAVLAPETLARLTADPSALVRAETAPLPGLGAGLLRVLAADPDPAVRAAACAPAWDHLCPAAREALLTDPAGKVRTAALVRRHHDEPLDEHTLGLLGGPAFPGLDRCRLHPSLALRLAAHEDPEVRGRIADHPDLPPAGTALLAEDPDPYVRHRIALRPDLTEERRAAVRVDLDTTGRWPHALPWVAALHDDPGAMSRLAASSHPYVRGSVARARRLPPDAVARLARDEHRAVRLFLAESCEDAPAEMLLEVWHWWTGSLTHPDRPRSHPRFPRAGLLRFATDPNPRLRRLALRDPEATGALVEEFSHDPSEEVRQDTARDPRLLPAAAARLAEDPDSTVRALAARHPALPGDVLLRLLSAPETAGDAIRNPALPLPVMRRITDVLTAVVRG